jgi:glutamine synthetase adenylyltransferase
LNRNSASLLSLIGEIHHHKSAPIAIIAIKRLLHLAELVANSITDTTDPELAFLRFSKLELIFHEATDYLSAFKESIQNLEKMQTLGFMTSLRFPPRRRKAKMDLHLRLPSPFLQTMLIQMKSIFLL